MQIQGKDLKMQKRNNRWVPNSINLCKFSNKSFHTNEPHFFQVSTKKKEEGKKGSGAKDEKGEKKGKEDEEDLGYKLASSEFVKQLKAADKTFIGEIEPF
jgi:hypothetical protein